MATDLVLSLTYGEINAALENAAEGNAVTLDGHAADYFASRTELQNGYATKEELTDVSNAVMSGITGKKITVSLPVASWSSKTQTVTATGVTAANDLLVSANPSCLEAYNKAGVYASAQAANSITFKCSSVPIVALSANVMILEGVVG